MYSSRNGGRGRARTRRVALLRSVTMEAEVVLTRAGVERSLAGRRASAKGVPVPTVHPWPARGSFCATAEPLLAGGTVDATSHPETSQETAPTTT